MPQMSVYNKSPTHRSPRCELSKMQTCVRVLSRTRPTCLVCSVACVPRLRRLCFGYCAGLCRVLVPGLYFKTRVSSLMRGEELLPRHHWIVFFKRIDIIESSKALEPVPSTSGWVKLHLALRLLLLTILPLCHLPPTLPAQSLIFLACSLRANPCVSAVVLYFSRYLYCKIYFFVCFLMCYLCESYL